MEFKILIVEGDSRLRAGLRAALEECGFAAAEAGDGREAEKKAAADSHRIILLDLDLPDKDGMEVLRSLILRMSGNAEEQGVSICF